ncbi:CU044_5270 family protein [Streptomyces sp. NPDC087843]|uniref:CU044_5270 family protein n=1 Tax=Streptomyces sp. NPDC087843 TaxID=3365804 RepID=UPI00380360BF
MKNGNERSGRPDVMQVLAGARPDELDPARLADSPRQREDLDRILAGVAEGGASRSRVPGPVRLRGRIRPLSAATALAAVAASVVVVSTVDQREPSGPPDAHPQSSTATAGSSASAPDLHVDGRLELLSAARKAETSATGGTYWQTTTRSENVEVAGEKGGFFAVRTTSTEQWSVGVRAGAQSLMVSGLDSVTEPLTRADEARWRAAGSPHTVRFEVENSVGTNTLGLTMGTRPPMVMRTNLDDRIYALGPRNVSYQDLGELPSKSGELLHYLERLHAADSGAETAGRTAWILRQTADLITMPVKPAVRAAAYRVMADLPGVRLRGRVSDPLGREGVGVVFPGTDRTPLGITEQRLVVDPATGAMLSEQQVLVEPSARAREAGLKAGATLNYQATTRMSWGEHQIKVPKNAHH